MFLVPPTPAIFRSRVEFGDSTLVRILKMPVTTVTPLKSRDYLYRTGRYRSENKFSRLRFGTS